MASMSVSGVVSGMDWDSMIDSIIESATKPAQPKVSKKTNLTNKKSLFEEMKVTMNSLQSSLSPLKLPSTYKAKDIEIERLDNAGYSYKGVLTATVNADADVNVWEVEVKQLATAQTNRSKQISASTLASTLSGVSGSTFYINAGGQKIGIEVKSDDTLQSLKSRINTTLKTLDNPIHVTASVVDNRLILKSDYTGLGTFTAEETVNYNSTGINRLSNFSVNDSDRENVTITNGSTKYTYGTDFEIANGNEIRWKQYDRSAEVALNDTVNVKYTMAAGDKYENRGTYGTGEAEIENFNVKDFGTLSSRLKIVDENNIEYVYGQDFTIKNNKVVWLEEEGAKTNEPSSYTVSYNKNEVKTASASATKSAVGPTSYTVSYSKTTPVASTTTTSAGAQQYISYSFDGSSTKSTFTDFLQGYADAEGLTSTSGLSETSTGTVSGVSSHEYVTNMDNISIDGYEYGKDYVLRRGNSGQVVISWNNLNNIGHDFVNDYRTNILHDTSSVTGSYPSAGDTFTIDYTHTYKYNTDGSGDALSDVLATALSDSGNYSGLVVTDSDGNTYSYDNGDFSIIGGQIIWNLTSDDDIDISDVTTKFNAVNGTNEIPRVTLTDGNGVLRTYLDLAGDSGFTMTDQDGKTYEYGRDYVVRVNDNGNGYVVTWAIASDTNGDGKKDIKDADTVLTTYAQYKELSTYGMKAAPETDKTFNFAFQGTSTTPITGKVNSTDTDKTLTTVLSGTSVSPSDYSSLSITSGSTTYTYGKDYVVDKTGTITWLNQNSTTPAAYTANYTFSSNASKTVSGLSASNTLTNVSGLPTLSRMGVETFSYTSTAGTHYYVAEDEGKAAFTLTDSNGNTYEYGKDFALRSTSTTGGTLQLVMAPYGNEPTAFSDWSTTRTIPSAETLTLTYNNSVSRTVISSETVKDALGFLPSDESKLSITDNDGNAYVKDTDYTLDPSTGAVTWLNATSTAPKHPSSGVGYTLVYDAFTAIDYNGTYSGNATQEAEIVVDSGYGNIDGNKRSYEQILSDTGLASSSESSDWAKYFTLTDSTTTYTYGTDYTIIQGSDTDSDTGEHNVLINWLSGGTKPAANVTFTLSYGGNGGESLTTKGVTRSAVDTISGSPLVADFDDGTTTITYGGKTFYNGIDFNIGKDDDGNATVEWVTDGDGGYEWYYPTSNSRYTINHTDDNGSTTSYSATRTGSSVLSMSDYGMTTATGSIGVQYGDDERYFNLDAPDSGIGDGRTIIKGTYGIDITPTTGSSFTFNWAAPTLTSRTNLPSYGTELKVQYEYDANTFDLADDCDGELLQALGYTKSDGSYDDYTAAQDAEIYVDGNLSYRASNDIGADYDNELIKGVTMHLKGTGTVSLDISHDAQKAVEAIQSFVDNYNDLMTWMNTRMTEKEVDKDTKSTIDSDDFRMRWGLLHGNSLLRQTKTQMRSLTSQNFTFSFTQRKSSEEVYGTMAFNGLRTTSTLRLRIGTKYVDVTIDPADTLETIVAKINDDSKGGPMNDIYYDSDGNKLASPLLKASVENDKLVINSTSSDEITMSGSAAMNVLKMNYTYKGLYQIGIESTSDDYGKSGELVFDANEFMEALEDNPDEVQSLMLKFVDQFSTWTRSMLNSSSSGETSGTLTREIENIQSQIDDINEYLEKYQERLDRMEESLRTRYANTETSLSKLNQQAASIASILNQLNGAANNNNSNS